MIILVSAEALYYTYKINTDTTLQWGVALIVLCVATYILIRRARKLQGGTKKKLKSVSKLVLLDEDGESVKEWFIQGETSLLIGKSSSREEVDIDLSDTEYASLISLQHAVLNYSEGSWYLEDLDSRNGIGIRSSNQSAAVRLDPDATHRVEIGDLIYLANTRIIAK
ncbi:FHA domain-containing protein [Cohnella terricola]|uniref:FHA domain-containing protein n=2 Tax=Cohnella terricola TaxID=1289167 RepID=A0A559J5K1_9BACL|nr:FHA domain-containing protein [Cohnella terricola]